MVRILLAHNANTLREAPDNKYFKEDYESLFRGNAYTLFLEARKSFNLKPNPDKRKLASEFAEFKRVTENWQRRLKTQVEGELDIEKLKGVFLQESRVPPKPSAASPTAVSLTTRSQKLAAGPTARPTTGILTAKSTKPAAEPTAGSLTTRSQKPAARVTLQTKKQATSSPKT